MIQKEQTYHFFLFPNTYLRFTLGSRCTVREPHDPHNYRNQYGFMYTDTGETLLASRGLFSHIKHAQSTKYT
jgi:hypothetical protein